MTKLIPFQLEGARQIRAFDGRALLADEMGLGKTIQALYYVHKMRNTRPVVVICPASLKYTWEREAKHHFGMRADVLSSRKPRKGKKWNAPVLIINYQILKWWVPYLVSLRPRIVIFDEAHAVQNKKTQRFQALKQLLDEAEVPYRIAITGTPLTKNPYGLWGPLHLLRPDLFKSDVVFGFEYCHTRFIHGKRHFVGGRNLAQLHAQLRECVMIRRLKKDVQKDLPAKIRRVIPLDLTPAGRKEYRFATAHFLRWLKEKFPSRVIKAKKNTALTSIGYRLRLLARLKWKMAVEWIDNFAEESEEKLIVFSTHTAVIDHLMKRYKGRCVRIDGAVTGKKRQQAIDSFARDERTRYAFCNPEAAGVGYTMVSCSNVLFYDYPWNPGDIKQCEDRVHRIGQKKTCFIWFMPVRDTIEEMQGEIIQEKQGYLDQTLDGIKEGERTDFDVFQEIIRREHKTGFKLK